MKEITVNGIKYIQAKGVKKELVISEPETKLPFEVGKSYFIRGVTYHLTGRVIDIVGKFLKLEDAAWIADSGRFEQFIKNGDLSKAEVESVGEAIINTDAINDAFPWKHELPDKQK